MNTPYLLEAGSVSRCLAETLVSARKQEQMELVDAYRVCKVEKGRRCFPVFLGLQILLCRIEGRWHRGWGFGVVIGIDFKRKTGDEVAQKIARGC
jgi:hypothetical protein